MTTTAFDKLSLKIYQIVMQNFNNDVSLLPFNRFAIKQTAFLLDFYDVFILTDLAGSARNVFPRKTRTSLYS